MPGNIRIWGTTGYVELTAPSTAINQVLTLPTDSVQPALVLVASHTFSGASSFSINNCFTSAYENYKINISSVTNSTNAQIRIRLRAAGVDAAGSNYARAGVGANVGASGAISSIATATTTEWFLAEQNAGFSNNIFAASLDILQPAIVWPTRMLGLVHGQGAGDYYLHMGMWSHGGYVAYDGITIFPSAGTLGATIRVYGYRNS